MHIKAKQKSKMNKIIRYNSVVDGGGGGGSGSKMRKEKKGTSLICARNCSFLWHTNSTMATYVGGLKSSRPRPQMATISADFFLSWYICHKHPCENASHSIKQFVLYSCLKQECCLYPLKWIKLSIVRL